MAISFHYQTTIRLKHITRLKEFLSNIFERERHPLHSLGVVFCTDEYLLEINRTFLQHDYYTDIITFDLSEPGSPIVGELYISIERVRENSIVHNVSFSDELNRVLFHGVLHLCGFNDKTKIQREEIRKKEDFYLNLYLQ